MKIIYQNRAGETITRRLEIFSKATVGMRINEFIIESWEEAKKLSTDEGHRWFASCILPAFIVTPKPVVLKESNWGSDWVDDGV